MEDKKQSAEDFVAQARKRDLDEWNSGFIPSAAPGEKIGFMDPFWETGTEGVIWSIHMPGTGYEGLHCLGDGDKLTVYDIDGKVVWEGIIEYEYETGKRPYPMNPEYGQQEVFGMWVHGCQKGMSLEDWAHMFFGPDIEAPGTRYVKRLRAKVVPGPNK